MRGRSVEGEKEPENTPNNANCPRSVEDGSPSKVGNEKSAKWIGQSDPDAEPCIRIM